MRLLRTISDGKLELTRDYIGEERIPDYAILSHTWKGGEEVTFDDMKDIDATLDIATQSNEGYRKIRFCAQQAKRDGLNYFWIDSCCINQSSSAELHEAINSMFRWYQNARKCYVFLSDVESDTLNGDSRSSLMKSRWFTRGWTLQELLAPPSVDFFSKEGTRLGDKKSLRDIIQDITGIPGDALSGRQLPDFSLADRFSWAAHRRTTRPEDEAYCLLGIFDIQFPLIYGEGKEKALKRLRKEIRESGEEFANIPGYNANTRNRTHQEKLSKIFNSLSAPDPTTNYREARKRRQAGTGLWLLESRKFKEWRGGAASPLWLYGIPGCGKTILSSTVIENLLQHCHDEPGMVVAYFYFDFNDAQKRDPELMVRSLFCQLMQRSVAYPEAIDALYSSCENGQIPSLDALLEAMQQVTLQLTHVYIVIDALDECTYRTDLMDSLKAVIRWRLDNVHLLMTSRKERDIDISLETYLTEKDTICLQRDVVDDDIQRYVKQRLFDDKRLAKWNKDQVIRREIETAMMDRARGMFRWAVCQLDIFTTCRNRVMLRESLATLPQTLDQTYDRILLAISKQERKYAMRILRWLAFSARPLSVEEVAEAAAIDLARSPAFHRDEVLEDPLEALSICSSLVTIAGERAGTSQSSRKTIALAHYSVLEYLVSDRIKQGKAQHYGMKEVECHTAMLKGSVEYLNQFQHPLSRRDLETHALARYAAEFWSSHFRRVNEPSNELTRLVLSLLSEESPAYHAWVQLYDPDNPWMGPNLEGSLKHVATPLYYAALLGLSTISESLLEQGAQVDAEGGRWGNALQAASYGGHERVVKMLLDNKANANARGGPHGSALNAAVAESNEAVVKILLAEGADVEGANAQLKSVLHHAVNSAGCKPSLVTLLLDRGAPLNTVDVDNMTPLHYSVKLGHKSVAETLLDRGCSIDIGIQRKTWCPKTIEQHIIYEEFSSEPLPQFATQAAGLTPLHFAALTGNSVMTEFLLQHGADPNALSVYGETPLHTTLRKTLHGTSYRDEWTDSHSRVECLEDLFDFEEDAVETVYAEIAKHRGGVLCALLADPRTILTLAEYQNEHPLHCVEYGKPGSLQTVKALVARGADPSAKNSKQRNALHLASRAGDHDVVAFLLSQRAEFALSDQEGLNALHHAAGSGHFETMSLLLKTAKATNPDLVASKDAHGRNLLHHLSATFKARKDTIRLLLDVGVDGSVLDAAGSIPLATYFRKHWLGLNVDICRLLVSSEGTSSFVDENGQNLGHLCASTLGCRVQVLDTLRNHGVELTQKDLRSKTLLHCAAISGSVTKELLYHLLHVVGIEVNAEDASGKTALQLAAEMASKDHHPQLFDSERWDRTTRLLSESGAI